jgi:hypothetical protein
VPGKANVSARNFDACCNAVICIYFKQHILFYLELLNISLQYQQREKAPKSLMCIVRIINLRYLDILTFAR